MSEEDEKQNPSEFVFETDENAENAPTDGLEGLAGLDLNLDPAPEAPVATEAPAVELAVPAPTAEPAPAPEAVPPAEQEAPRVDIPAAFPFTLSVTGRLSPAEQEKLLDVLSRENIGIRELDLEAQFQAGRILIPRISEYAGVLLVHALRGCSVEIKLLPSDLSELLEAPSEPPLQTSAVSTSSEHPAELLTVTQTESLPGVSSFEIVGVMSASAILRSETIEAENSPDYAELLDSLTREMKYKAFRKGAVGIVKFQIELTPLHTPSDYRLTLTGTAIKPAPPSGLNPDNPSI